MGSEASLTSWKERCRLRSAQRTLRRGETSLNGCGGTIRWCLTHHGTEQCWNYPHCFLSDNRNRFLSTFGCLIRDFETVSEVQHNYPAARMESVPFSGTRAWIVVPL